MMCKLYKLYIRPLARVVRGAPISWEPNFATAGHSHEVQTVAWSSCSRFVAVGLFGGSTEVLDAITLERLHTFTHRSSGGGWLSFSPDSRSLTQVDCRCIRSTTWDLQTGGQIGDIPINLNVPSSLYFLSTYSMDGKMAAIAYKLSFNTDTVISTYNLISATHIYSHYVSKGYIVAQIWTHGQFIRFAAVKPGYIIICEVGFTIEHTLAEIESLPAPDYAGHSKESLFLPTLSRLAFILQEAVLIWDAQDSKFLLNFVGGGKLGGLSFSSDGRFFACGSNIGQEVHLWKESPTGYVLHRKLVPGPMDDWIRPFLSPDGESIITSRGNETQLWRTTDPINPPPSVPQPAQQNDFVLAFSPDKSFITTGRLGGNIATIVDLKSGDPRLIVDTGMVICGLGVTADAVVVVGEGKIITWNLPTGDCVLNARANIHDSVRTIVFNHPPPSPGSLHYASLSPDFNYFVITWEESKGLDIYDMSTGKDIVGSAVLYAPQPWFTRDGREVWHSRGFSRGSGQKIVRGGGSDIIGLEPLGDGDGPSRGYLWESSHGYKVTDDGWILDSRKKRIMWLPHHWRVYELGRIEWDGQFLALIHPGLPEPVVIELYK